VNFWSFSAPDSLEGDFDEGSLDHGVGVGVGGEVVGQDEVEVGNPGRTGVGSSGRVGEICLIDLGARFFDSRFVVVYNLRVLNPRFYWAFCNSWPFSRQCFLWPLFK
jgi:hypothetical protein